MAWEYRRIGDVCTVERGGSPRPIDQYITDEQDGINWIKIGDTTDSMFITSTAQKIKPEGAKKSRYVQPGDFLLTNSMSFGRPYILKIDGCIHDGWLVLRDNDGRFDKRFLYYYLSSPYVYHTFQNMAEGGVVNNLNSKMVRELMIPVPSITEQSHIADFFGKVDNLISLRKKQLQKLDDLVKSRFVEMFGNPVTNEKSWMTISLDNACDGIGDGLHGTPEYDDEGEYPFINGNNLIDGMIEITPSTKMVGEATYQKHYTEITDNAILISINGTLGKMAFYRGEKVMLGKSACYCNLKPTINREFVYSVMKSDAFAGFLESNSTKSTIKNVGLKAMRGFQLIIPPNEFQLQFVEFARHIDISKLTIQQGLDKLEQMKQALMQKYFS